MKTFRKTFILVAIVGITTIFGCAKDGENGKDGLPGPAGPTGNANVKSLTFDVYSWNWSSNNAWLYSTDITEAIVNSGSVQVYMETSSYSGKWAALPFNSSGVNVIYAYEVNYVNIVASPQPTSHERFKIVIIASSARLANPNIDYTNYYEVKTAI